jgi:hypothetical protein
MKFTLYLHFVGLYFENFCLKFCRIRASGMTLAICSLRSTVGSLRDLIRAI